MKKSFFKTVCVVFVGVMSLASCSKDSDSEQVTVTEKYRIILSGARSKTTGTASPGINALVDYHEGETAKINATYGKTEYTITVTADTESAAQAIADKKAKEEFKALLPKLNEEAAKLKTGFEQKRASLAADIVKETGFKVVYTEFGPALMKIENSSVIDWDIIESGTELSFEAIGGTQY